MRSRVIATMLFALLASQLHAQQPGEKKASPKSDESPLKTLQEKASYSIGLSVGKDLKSKSIEVDLAALTRGLKDALSGSTALLTDAEIREVFTAYQKELQEKQAERDKEVGDKNKKEGEEFLAENKEKEGVKTLPSGLQYKVMKQGKGKSPKSSDTVTTHYRGTLIDGTEFDSSQGGEPATFKVSGVIKGWTEALQLMQVGAKWQLFIPSNLAYGERGAPPDIGPHATLIFDIELISIK